MVGLTGSRRKHAIAGMQRDCIGRVAFWPLLLDNGNRAVAFREASAGGIELVMRPWTMSRLRRAL